MALFQNKYYSILTALMLCASVLQAGNLGGGNLRVEPQSSATLENTIHTVKWTTITPIDVRARFVLYYDSAFNLDQLIMATTIDSATMDGRLNIDTSYFDATSGMKKIYISRKDRTTGGEGLVGINLAMIGNPAPGDYTFRLETWGAGIDPDDPMNAPEDSGSAVITITEPIKNFDLAATNYVPRAGQSFDLQVTNAVDNEGNPASGIILVSFNDGLGHEAPDGTQPTLVSIPVVNGSGSATQTLVKVENNLFLKGTVSGGTTSRVTNPIDVKPGDVGSFTLTGYPATTIAGTDFGAAVSVRIKAYDNFGNAKTDLTGNVHFESVTDTKEYFTYDISNPYVFTGNEDGEAVISGEEFEFRTAGFQTFSVVHGMISTESTPINVLAGAIDSFDFDPVTNQTAGVQFMLNVQNAVDVFGNPASGTVNIDFSSGDHNAPNGQAPVFTSIQVVNGQGSAYQTLFKTETVFLKGETVGSVARNTNLFTVSPSALASFSLSGYPQSTPAGQFFVDDVIVTAFDAYGNQKTDFNASVTFSSTDTNPEVVLPPETKFTSQASRRFIGSLFKLMTLGTQTITVESGGKSGTTAGINVIGVNEIQIVRITTDPATVTQGQTQIPVSMEVRNNGSDVFDDYSANLNFRIGPSLVNSDYVSPVLTGSAIGAGSTVNLNFLVDVRSSAALSDSVILDGAIIGSYNGVQEQVDQALNVDSWAVQREAVIQIKSVDVEQDTIPQGSGGIIVRAKLANNEGVDYSAAAIIDDLVFVFQDQTFSDVSSFFSLTAAPENPTTIAGNDSAEFVYYLSSDESAPLGPISVSLNVSYQDANLLAPKNVSGSSLDSFESVGAASIIIHSITPDQLTVTQGQTNSFRVVMHVKNKGASSFNIDFAQSKTYLKFLKAGQEHISPDDLVWPSTLRGGGATIAAGDSGYIDFWVNQIQPTVPTGNYIILGRVETTDRVFTTSDLSDSYGALEVQSAEDIIIQKVYPSQPSATVNNSSHPWKIGVVLQNRGGSDVSVRYNTSQLVLTRNGSPVLGFEFGTPYLFDGDAQLSGGETDTLFFPVTKTGSPSGPVMIDAHIEYVINNTGQTDSRDASSTGQTGTVILQDPADFRIVSVVSSLDSVSIGANPAWQVAVNVENRGEADVALDLDSADSTWLKFYLQGSAVSGFNIEQPTALLNNGGSILAGGESDALVYTILSNTANAGEYEIKSAVKTTEMNTQTVLYDETQFTRLDTVLLVSPSSIAYIAETLAPVQAAQGRNIEFQLRVQNSGDAAVVLDPETTTFTINGGAQQFVAKLDPAYGQTIPGQGEKLLIFQQTYLSSNIPDGTYTPQVFLSGVENGNLFNLSLDMQGATVVIGNEGEIHLENLLASTATVTQGQTKNWFIEVGVTNNSVQPLKFKSAEIIFNMGTQDVSNEFVVQIGDTLANGEQVLQSGASSAVRATVVSVSENILGDILLSAKVTMTDLAESGILFEQQINNAEQVTVQTPADLQVISFQPSQLTVTRGQTETWTVGAILRNDGQSALRINNLTDIDFIGKDDTKFSVINPTVFIGSNSDTLSGMSEDSLFFQINHVDSDPTMVGQVSMNAVFVMDELNTGQIKTRNSENASVTIQDSARVRIDDFKAVIESDSLVNAGQIFYVRALVTNIGGANADMIKTAIVKVAKDSPEYSFVSGIDTVSVDSIAPGESKWTTTGIRIQAPANAGIAGQFTANVDEAIARNTNNAIAVDSPVNNVVRVWTQNPADFRLLSVVSERDTVSSGFSLPWSIFATVVNYGDGVIELQDFNSSDFQVYDADDNLVSNYVVDPVPLDPAQRQLVNGDSVTIEFVVKQTWKGAGAHRVDITIHGKELNNTAIDPIELNGSTNIFMTSNAAVRIVETRIDSTTNNVDENGDGYVNTNQDYYVRVKVRSEGGQYIGDVSVILNALESQVLSDTQVVHEIAPNISKEASFHVKAGSVENLAGDLLTARIVSGHGIDGDGAIIKTAFDSTAKAVIHNPAQLRIVSTENLAPNPNKHVSLGQYFDIRVKVQNEGSETAKNIVLSLVSADSNMAQVESSQILLTNPLAGGAIDSVTFRVKAGNQEGPVAFISAVDSAIGANTEAPLTILDPGNNNSTFALLTPGADLQIKKVWPSVDNITAGVKDQPWKIWVEVENRGGADLEFVGIADTNIVFSVNGVLDDGYKVIPPDGLESSNDFVLKANSVDTLGYNIDRNGELSGEAQFYVVLKAVDKNTNGDSLLTAVADSSIAVANNALVRIFESVTNAKLQDENGFALVNRGQEFSISVKVQSGQNVGLENVIVELTTSGQSLAQAVYDTLESIEADDFGTAMFSIRADDSWDAAQGDTTETFTAAVIQAFAVGDTTPVTPRTPAQGANIAKVRIQTPAELSYKLQLGEFGGTTVEKGSEFLVLARMRNLGKAPIGVGKLTLTPPQGYLIKDNSNTWQEQPMEKSFSLGLGVDSLDVPFTLLAPDTVSGPDSVMANIVETPKDLNTDEAVLFGNIDSLLVIRSDSTLLAIESMTIISPPGAQNQVLSTEQQFTIEAVISSSKSIPDRKATLNVPLININPSYEILSPSAIDISSERDTLQWVVSAPVNPVAEAHDFELIVTGGVPDENFYRVTKKLTISQIQRRVTLSLEPLQVSPKGVMKDGEAYFTQNQSARIVTSIKNFGDAAYEGTGKVELDLGDSGFILESGELVQEFFDESDIWWDVRAPGAILPEGKEIKVRITETPTDVNSNTAARVSTNIRTLVAHVNEGGNVVISQLTYLATNNEAIDSVSSEQPFTLRALIQTANVKETDIKATLFSTTGQFQIIDPEKIIPTVGAYNQMWTVIAPAFNGEINDSLYVRVEALDLQSEEVLVKTSAKITVPVVQRTLFTFEPFISLPLDMQDKDKLSSGQKFNLTARIHHHGAPFVQQDSFKLQISLPIGFELDEGETPVKSVVAKDFVDSLKQPTWRLLAPQQGDDNLARISFLVRELPHDFYSKLEAKTDKEEVIFPVRVVEKAKVNFSAYLHDDSTLDSASVRSGNIFKISSMLENIGDAGFVGEYSIQLMLPDSFHLAQGDTSLIKTTTADTASWWVQAPLIVTDVPDTFHLKLLNLPLDEFAKVPVALESDSTATIQVILQRGALIVNDYPVREKTGVVIGSENVPIMGLILRNKDASGVTSSYMQHIQLTVRNKKGESISPKPMISRIAAVKHNDDQFILAESRLFGDSGAVTLDFTVLAADTILGSMTDSIKFVVDLKPDAELNDFMFTIDSTGAISAIDEYGLPLVISDSTGERAASLSFSSMMAVMIDGTLEESFFNYPNPFGSVARPVTNFNYYLKEDSDVRIYVYTLTGELVRTWEFTQAEHPELTSAGLHQGEKELIWDGTNGMGHPIVNGVYLAFISTDYGEQASTKIAVVR